MELTFNQTRANIIRTSPHVECGIGNPFNKGAIAMCRPVYGFFYVPSFMVGVLGSLRTCRFLCPVYQPSTSTARGLVTSGGSLKTTTKESAMSQHSQIQNPTKANTHTNSVSLKSIFSLLDSNKNPIASSLTFEQVKPLSEHIQGSVIKFQAMVKIGVLS